MPAKRKSTAKRRLAGGPLNKSDLADVVNDLFGLHVQQCFERSISLSVCECIERAVRPDSLLNEDLNGMLPKYRGQVRRAVYDMLDDHADGFECPASTRKKVATGRAKRRT